MDLGYRDSFGEQARGTGMDLGNRDKHRDGFGAQVNGTGMDLGNRNRRRDGCRIWGTAEGLLDAPGGIFPPSGIFV